MIVIDHVGKLVEVFALTGILQKLYQMMMKSIWQTIITSLRKDLVYLM